MFMPKRITECREAIGITQEELMICLSNEGLKVSRPTLSNWETGNSVPDANDLVALTRVFSKPLKYFFDNKINKTV